MRALKTMKMATIAASLVLLPLAGHVAAVSIPINNNSFELPTIVPGGQTWFDGIPTNWTGVPDEIYTWVEDSASLGFTGGEGPQHGGIEQLGGYIYQDLGVPFQANTTYRVDLAGAHRSGTSHGEIEFGVFSTSAIGSTLGNAGMIDLQGIWTGSGNPDADDQFDQFRDASVLNTIDTNGDGVGALGRRSRFDTGNTPPSGNVVVFIRDSSSPWGDGLRVQYDNIRLDASPSLLRGDVDLDGDVDLVDLGLIQSHFRTAVGSRSLGDLDEDNFVDFKDYLEWHSNYPFPGAGMGASGSVPEPSSLLMLWVGAFMFFAARRHSRWCLLAVMVITFGPSASFGAVTMTFSNTAPTTGPSDQFDFTSDATVPGGTTPGGATYNSQAFSDNGGPPGQIFSTPAGSMNFVLNSLSLKGANTGGGNSGGVFGNATTWGLRVSSVSGTTLTPVNTFTGIPTVTGATGIEWYTWSFTGADILQLMPSTQYAFEVYSSAGYLGFDADTTDGYTGGTAFNSAGAARSFSDNTTGNLADHGYDRTFHVALGNHVFRAGDVDDDGDVDLADFALIRDHFDLSVTSRSMGDLDGDGIVDFPDYRQWKANYPFPGTGAGAGANASVPEPTAWLLGSIAGWITLSWRRRQSRAAASAQNTI